MKNNGGVAFGNGKSACVSAVLAPPPCIRLKPPASQDHGQRAALSMFSEAIMLHKNIGYPSIQSMRGEARGRGGRYARYRGHMAMCERWVNVGSLLRLVQHIRMTGSTCFRRQTLNIDVYLTAVMQDAGQGNSGLFFDQISWLVWPVWSTRLVRGAWMYAADPSRSGPHVSGWPQDMHGQSG